HPRARRRAAHPARPCAGRRLGASTPAARASQRADRPPAVRSARERADDGSRDASPRTARVTLRQLVLAEDPDQQQDDDAEHDGEDDRRPARDADRLHPEPEEEEEDERPEEGLDAVVDRGRTEVHRRDTLTARSGPGSGLPTRHTKRPPEGGRFIRRADYAFVPPPAPLSSSAH